MVKKLTNDYVNSTIPVITNIETLPSSSTAVTESDVFLESKFMSEV